MAERGRRTGRRPHRARCGWRHRAEDLDGFTLVEVLVTIALIAIVFVPLGRIFLSTQGTASDDSARQQELGLDTAVLAKIQTMNYYELGLTSSDVGAAGAAYSSAAHGTLVTIASDLPDVNGAFSLDSAVSPVNFNVVLPKVFWGDRSFKVTTWVVWGSSYVPACPTAVGQPATTQVPQAEKRVTVTASWYSPFSGWLSASESTIVYPGGLAPYRGTEAPPAQPGTPTPTLTTSGGAQTTERLYVSWTTNPTAGCYAISWVTPDQAVHSTGLVSNSDPGYIDPPPTGTSGTAVYALDGLPPGESVTVFVTAYTSDGTVWTTSADSAHTQAAPTGPTVTSVSGTCPSGVSSPCAYGGPGSQIQVTGTGFTGGAAMTLVQESSQDSIGTCAASPCSLSVPTGLTGTWSVIATLGGVSSPPDVPSDFSFNPTITGLSPTSGTALTSFTVTGTNFILNTTFSFNYTGGGGPASQPLTATACTPAPNLGGTVGATQCTLTMPLLPGFTIGQAVAGSVIASSAGGTSPSTLSDVYTYTAP